MKGWCRGLRVSGSWRSAGPGGEETEGGREEAEGGVGDVEEDVVGVEDCGAVEGVWGFRGRGE